MRQKQFLLAFLAMLLCFAAPSFAQNVAEVGGTEYTTLADAISNASAGQTITLVGDVTEDVTVSKAVTIDGARKTYTGAMTLKADATIKNVIFDGKGYNGYAITTRGAQYLTIEDCTAKNYGYGFVQLPSATALTTVKNVTVSNMNYGVKVDYSNAVVLEDVNITAGVAAVLNSNYGGKTITIKNGKLNILGTWKRNDTTKTTYVFEGANTVGEFKTYAAIDNFKLAGGATLTAPEEIEVTTDKCYNVEYAEGKYISKFIPAGSVAYRADVTDKADREGIAILLKEVAARESLVVKVYNDETLMFTCTRRDIDDEGKVMFPVLGANTTANIVLWGKESGSWINEIHVEPTNKNVPNKVEILADGTLVETYTHESGTILGTNLEKYLALECVEKVKDSVAKIGEQGYETFAAALAAAQAGQTITFVADITEDVTITKSLTIDGAGKTYTGKMTLKADATIKNVNFDGKGYNGYAVETRGANYLTIEGGTAKNYGYGFVQLASGTVLTTVKDVTVSDMNYGVKVDYSNAVSLENVKMTNVKYGILNSNYGEKTITIKNSELTSLSIWERNQTKNTTFKFEGENTIDAFPESLLVKYEGVVLGDKAYGELTDALAAVKANDVLNIYSNYTIDKYINVVGNLTINGNGKTLTYTGSGTSARAITVESGANGANLTINNLIVDCTASYCQRGINYNTNGALVLNGVTVKGTNVTYALNLPGSSDRANVTINNSSLTGNIALNVWGENATINAENSNFTSVDNNTAEGYAAVKLNNDGTTSAEGTVINIEGGKIDVTGTECTDTEAVSNGTSSGVIKISESTVVNGKVVEMVAVIRYADGNSYSFTNIKDAIAKANDGETVTLLRDITSSDIITINKAITLDGNGKTLNSTAGRAINVSGVNGVTIKNLIINASGERAINIIQNATNVTIKDVTATAANYTVNVAASAPGAKVAINNSNLTGLNVVNVAAENAEVTINGGVITCNDQNANENYAALCLNKDAKKATITATGVTFDIKGDSLKAKNGADGGVITIDGSTEGVSNQVAYIDNGGNYYYAYATLADAVAAAQAGETVKLITDAKGAGVVIDKSITIDFNGKTYTANEGVGSAGTQTLGLQILKDNNVTLKNGTLTSTGDKVKMLVQNYANLTVEDMNLVGTANAIQYVLSNNSGNVVVKGTSEITANGAIAFDACKYANYAPPTVTIEEGVVVTGGVEVSATLNMNGRLNGNIVINGAEGVVNGAEGLNVTTDIDGRKVAYVDGKYTVVAKNYIAQVGEAKYETLAEAVKAAQAGETVTLLANAEEDVTLSKNVTIDGAQKNYTGTMTVNNITVTIQNVAFVKGQVYKHKSTGSAAQITIKDCTFDGQSLNAYAVNVGNGVSLALENVTAKNYGYGLLQVPSSFSSISVKDVKVSNMYYGFKVDYAGAVSMENVTVADDVTTGIYDSNYGTKTYTIKNSAISSINIWERNQTYYTTFKFEGLNKVNTLPTSQYAKIVAEAKSSNNYYGKLAAVVDAATAGATVELLADVTLVGGNEKDAEAGLVIDKAMTLDGKNHTIDCGTFVKGIRIYGPSALTDIKINNVTIVNNKANGRCVDTRSGLLRLKFNSANLIALGTNSQPLTVGGNEKLHQIDLSKCTIDAGKSGYGIISFVPTNQAIKVMNSKVTGYAGIYLKGDGTNVTITTNSEVIGKNVYSEETNTFGAVVIEGNKNTVNINATSPMLKAIAEGNCKQAAILVNSGKGNNIVLDTAKGAEVLTEGENAYLAMVNENASATFTKNGVIMPLEAQCDNIKYLSLDEAYRASENGSTVKLLADVVRTTAQYVEDCDGYASIFNIEGRELTFDLNGMTMTVNAYAEDLADAKGEMLMAVFSTDEGGNLTLIDSSDAKTGKVEVVANDAMVYSLITNYEDGCFVTIEGGNYIADMVYDSLIYSGASDCVTINNGNYHLGNVGDVQNGQNGKPWIFNALGQNQRNIDVLGGTFNADINHQHWCFEVDVPNNRALRNNGDGTWTVVNAEAYVVEPKGKYTHEVGYPTLSEAIAHALDLNNTSVVMVSDVEMTDMIKVANGTAITLDLNGKTIAATDNTSKNYSLIDNRGDLTITGEGVMTVKATVNSGWNRYSAVIANNPGGKLIIESGLIEHLGGTDMAYGIDNLTNGKGTYAETIINGGTIKSPYRAIRQFLNGVEADNILTVNGGTIEGENKSIFFHDPSAKANNGTLTVGEEATLKGDVYLFVTAGSTEWPVEVMIAKDALEGNVLSANVPDGYAVSEYPTYWTVEALNLAELTIEDACTSYVNVAEKNVGKLTYVRNFENTEWQTIYLPFEVKAENLMAEFEVAYIYNASYNKVDGAAVYYVVVDGNYTLQANYPYLIRAKEAGEKSIVVTDAKLMPTAVNSIDCSSVFEIFKFTGNYATIVGDPCDPTCDNGHFVMNEGINEECGWDRISPRKPLNPFRVYMTIVLRNGEAFPTAQSINMVKVDKNGNVDTSVEKIGVDADILGIYDLQGRRVLEPQKGEIYIINGKKVVF